MPKNRVGGLESDAAGDQLLAAGRVLIDTHGADVLILGCAGMARFRQDIGLNLMFQLSILVRRQQYKRLLLFVSLRRLSITWLGLF
ncbi:MAG: hypothetical protein CM1200mP18_20940 [Gammaproteobacteria bacterium]|nr:MAG: hypothetical protein CM1200mP18_20940 [Gammaproteobacteria bacterium]